MAFWSKASAQKPSVSIASDSDSESQSLVATPPRSSESGLGTPTASTETTGTYGYGLPPQPANLASFCNNGSYAAASGTIMRRPSSRLITSPMRNGSMCGRGGSQCGGSYRQLPVTEVVSDTMRVLFIGCPQVGKSSLINCYRAAVTGNTMWPAAPVGICGYCGTAIVDPLPNHPRAPTFLCIDTPGKFYGNENQLLLSKLFAGIPWKTRIEGDGALTAEELEKLSPVPENKPHHSVLVVPATDLVEDGGWGSVFQLKSRYFAAPAAGGVVESLRDMIGSIRALQDDASLFVAVTKMDLVGGADNPVSRRIISTCLSRCVPVNRLYFCACPGDESSYERRGFPQVDQSTRLSLLRLHEDLSLSYHWKMTMQQQREPLSPT
ncbi:uncharacterized protein TEOVI_000102100 [Trypanosoma equiperdum]|uniref:Uncharacterized protein n=2 Tax=Trypanozoon TaxID=39700 RepID=Q38E73_TRYB2|nr:hypothetical protein, conserved [Trypanosoma brucei brucei TREU927]EAN76897.1 hypothetical protein, conserved [Trypanosoma brucei brucei TREU927]SCU69455.1 hypothetical protein, conserved [Trypanosoma equiperdum]